MLEYREVCETETLTDRDRRDGVESGFSEMSIRFPSFGQEVATVPLSLRWVLVGLSVGRGSSVRLWPAVWIEGRVSVWTIVWGE